MLSSVDPSAGPPARVLVVEDEPTVAANLLDYLAALGHPTDIAWNGHDALAQLARRPPDVLVLDLGLPGLDGLAVLQRLRHALGLSLPVLVLTARDGLSSKEACFAAGADDYVVKPFALSEVAWRVAALHRRACGAWVNGPWRVGAVVLDRRTRSVSVRGQPVHLPPRALRLLERLMRDPGRVVGRAELEALLWPDDPPDSDALRSQVYLLRRALAQAGCDVLETVPGQGWFLRPEPEGESC